MKTIARIIGWIVIVAFLLYCGLVGAVFVLFALGY